MRLHFRYQTATTFSLEYFFSPSIHANIFILFEELEEQKNAKFNTYSFVRVSPHQGCIYRYVLQTRTIRIKRAKNFLKRITTETRAYQKRQEEKGCIRVREKECRRISVVLTFTKSKRDIIPRYLHWKFASPKALFGSTHT